MATANTTVLTSQTTDAEFRAWVSAFIADMLTVGWVQSADTGQINTATVLKPTTGTQSMGTVVFTPNDGLTDFYLRIMLGSGGHGALEPAIYVQVGWTTDGATNLMGLQQSTNGWYRIWSHNANSAPGILTPRFCKVGSAFWFTWNEANIGGTPTNQGFGIDRSRDASGNATTEAVILHLGCAGGTRLIDHSTANLTANGAIEVIPRLNGNYGPVASNRVPYAAPNHGGTWARGGNTGVAPIVPWIGKPMGPGICAVVGSATDFASISATTTVSIYGVSRTYRQSGLQSDSGPFGRYLTLWE